jgi:hypothetical protein
MRKCQDLGAEQAPEETDVIGQAHFIAQRLGVAA